MYTPLNPGLPITGTSINGDLGAKVRLTLETSGDYLSGNQVKDMLLAMRSTARGAYFYPFFNFSTWQPRVTITATAVPTYDVSVVPGILTTYFLATPLGVHGDVICFDPAAPGGAGGAVVTISGSTAESMRGRYRFLMRVYQVGGASGDIKVNCTIYANGTLQTPIRWPANAGAYQWLDFGLVTIPMRPVASGDNAQIKISIGSSTDLVAAWPDLYLIDFAFVPVDENTSEVISNLIIPRQDEWILDSTDPKQLVTSYTRVQGTTVAGSDLLSNDVDVRVISPAGLRYQAGENQRLYWYSLDEENPGVLATAQSYHVGRYLSMRGDR
jgi:hypothetical protein